VFNLSLAQKVPIKGTRGAQIRFDVLNLFDSSYQLRDGSGVGVGAPQFGMRRTFLSFDAKILTRIRDRPVAMNASEFPRLPLRRAARGRLQLPRPRRPQDRRRPTRAPRPRLPLAHLGGLTDADRAALAKLGVKTIVDLRGVEEAAETPHLIDGLACRVVGAHIEPAVGERIRNAVADGTASPS
jgi:hypothetical protein